QYATVAGFAIVPNGSATINERETTYFPSSGKLKIALASNGAGGITVMIPGGAVPFLVVSQKNVKWSFGDGKLYIEATEPPMGAVTQVYFRTKRIAPLAGIVKDTEKLETIGYENSKALSVVMEAQEELENVKAEESNARANVTERNLILIEAKKNVNALQRDITGKAGKIAALNERTKGMSSLDYWGFAFLTALSGAAIYVSARKGAK
ncbi:MAG: hypothetical protein HY365_03605, partial [Candidatus Aenigmarchaeota archaeon]|nr:hypothetical protein [Candidatus Aenigmarchaeota archaeon]